MEKFLGGFVKIEKSLQIVAIVSIILLLGYLGFEQHSGDRAPAAITSPATQQ